MHLSSSPPGIPSQPSAASQIIELGLYNLEGLDRKVADACNSLRLLDDRFQCGIRMVTEASIRGDLGACERLERECAWFTESILKALLELGTTRAASLIGLGLKASTLAHFLPRFHDEVAEDHLLLMAAFADEVLAHYSVMAARGEEDGTSLWLERDDLRTLTTSILDYITDRESLLLSLAAAAQGHASSSVSEMPGEAEYRNREERFAMQLSQLAHQDVRSVSELLALAGIIAGLARQDPGAAISSFVIGFGLKLCDTLLLQPII